MDVFTSCYALLGRRRNSQLTSAISSLTSNSFISNRPQGSDPRWHSSKAKHKTLPICVTEVVPRKDNRAATS